MERRCEFQHDAAAECLAEVKDASCVSILDASAYTACTRVWGKCDGSEAECWGDTEAG